jgi:hypothetical protein
MGYLFLFLFLLVPPPHASAKWEGVDEAVIQKIAAEKGRTTPPAAEDRGNIPLTLAFGAGSLAGFVAGYNWRRLTERKPAPPGADSA